MVSYAKIFIFYASIAALICGVYLTRDRFAAAFDPGLAAGFFNEQKTAAEKKIAEVKSNIGRVIEKNPIDLNLEESVPELKIEIEKKIATLDPAGGGKDPATENKDSGGGPKSEKASERAGESVADDPATTITLGGKDEKDGDAGLSAAGVIAFTNRERVAALGAGSELEESSLLRRAAEYRLQDMFAKQYFAHESPDGLRMGYFLDKAGYEGLVSGENLAEGNFSGDSELVSGWMNSPGHRANILGNYQEIGVAVGYGMFEGRNVWLAVQFFGTPSTACVEPGADLEAKVDGAKANLENIKKELEAMSLEIDSMKQEAAGLKDRIARLQESGQNSKALEMNEALNPQIDAINEKVRVYNLKIAEQKSIYAVYRETADEYNAQVKEYNACLADL